MITIHSAFSSVLTRLNDLRSEPIQSFAKNPAKCVLTSLNQGADEKMQEICLTEINALIDSVASIGDSVNLKIFFNTIIRNVFTRCVRTLHPNTSCGRLHSLVSGYLKCLSDIPDDLQIVTSEGWMAEYKAIKSEKLEKQKQFAHIISSSLKEIHIIGFSHATHDFGTLPDHVHM